MTAPSLAAPRALQSPIAPSPAAPRAVPSPTAQSPAAAPRAVPGRTLAPPPTHASDRLAPALGHFVVDALLLALLVGLAWMLLRMLLSDPR